MNRYEEILTQFIIASIADGCDPILAVESTRVYKAAAILEKHFKEREMEIEKQRLAVTVGYA